jgi:hypothetical protein
MVTAQRSLWIALGTAVAAAATIAMRAPATPVASDREVRAAPLTLQGAVVLATPPTLNEILDIILGDTATTGPTTVASTSLFPAGSQEGRISAMLRRHTSDGNRADRIAQALVQEGRRSSIEPTLLVGVLLTENPDLEPQATSRVGARGLMQVMPFHAGHWGCPSSDLFDIESNICHGVRILADNLRHSPDLPTALLKYNGCVRGTNTPDCRAYARIVYGYARRSTIALDGPPTPATPFTSLGAPAMTRASSVARARTSTKKGIIVIPKELLVD